MNARRVRKTIALGRALAFAIALMLLLRAAEVAAQNAEAQRTSNSQWSTAALRALQDDDIESALESLAQAADAAPARQLSAHDGLSAAAGGLHRSLMQLSADERFDLLYAWTMPSESHPHVRILTALTPQDAPPKEFARVIGERPRATSFPVSEIGGIRGLFNTGWTLVETANEIGRLRRLVTELQQHVEQNTPGADVLLMLAQLADRRSETALVAAGLQQRATALLARRTDRTDTSGAIDPTDIILAASALEHEELRPISEQMLKVLIDGSSSGSSPHLRSFLQLAHATAVQLTHGKSGPDALYTNRLKYWIPATGATAEHYAGGAVNSAWFVHEDHILHLTGAGNDVLFFRYPLIGEFEFTCETQLGGALGTEGGLVYGGLQFEVIGIPERLTVWDADLSHPMYRPCPFVRQETEPTFNHMSIHSTQDAAVFSANRHPMWFDGASSKTSPWLGLRSFGERRPLFRNFTITGKPVIPRQVQLSEGDQLRGWQARFFNETLSPYVSRSPADAEVSIAPAAGTAQSYDWTIRDGTIQAARRVVPQGGTLQSLLKYQRPIAEGESVRYEFRYKPGAYEVHPALGRLAFIIEPGGVRIHWITSSELDWTGLPADNATIEPLNRRGPRPLPLKIDDWNQVTLARNKGNVTVSLNGEAVYERPVDYNGDLTFGLYRDAARAAVEVRNVVMTGDWPETLPDELLQNPAAVVDEVSEVADHHALQRMLGETFLADNVTNVRRKAAAMSPEKRYEFLARSILPGIDHAGFRVIGEFSPTDPSPLAVKLEPHRFHDSRGGDIVSPVFDLLDVAAETEKLAELRTRIESVPDVDDERQRRAKAALLLLVNLEIGDQEAAAQACELLQQLVVQATPQGTADMWPETLAIQRVMQRQSVFPTLGDLLSSLFSQRTRNSTPPGCEDWHARLAYWMEWYRYLTAGGSEELFNGTDEFEHWISVQRISSMSRGSGWPHTVWQRTEDDEAHHLSGHHEDYLLFRSPLRGNFEITGDIGGEATTQLFAAGKYFGVRWQLDEFETGLFREGHEITRIEEPFAHFHPWIRFRAAFNERLRSIYINGRLVHRELLPDQHDPWMGIRAWTRAVGKLRNVQIVGSAEIPEAVVLSESKDLTGWVTYYHESAANAGAIWQNIDDEEGVAQIVARRRPELAGSFCESLLTYQRPLVEGGAIEYEFFYEPGKVHAHPALDRLALLLNPTGVQIHWITDGRYDRTAASPQNVVEEPQHRRGPAQLPLKAGDWNQLRLLLEGDIVTLVLNGHTVYQRAINSANRRTFGLFYYADQTELRVRNVVMRGRWPTTLPQPSALEFGDGQAAALDADLPKLKSIFTHDFAKDGLPGEFFVVNNPDGRGQVVPRSDGVFMSRPGPGNWTIVGLRLPFTAVGDFDCDVTFDQLKLHGDIHSCIMLQAAVDDDLQALCRLIRIRHMKNRDEVDRSLSLIKPDGERSFSNNPLACELTAGKLRIARRGDTVHYLIADQDSEAYQWVGTHQVSAKPLVQHGIELNALCNGGGEAAVVWKSITLRAEKLKYLPPENQGPQRALYAMNADGSNVRLVTGPAAGFTHLGSPQWSSDGTQIALDMSDGSTSSSHIVVVGTHGSDLVDLGPGCMPSFSPDGKRIAFSQPGRGVMIMNRDGSDREVVDGSGWGIQWSPDGRRLAYGKSNNIVILEVDSRQQRLLLTGEPARRYSYIYWNFDWSRDNRWIAFKAQKQASQQYEVAIAEVDAPNGFQVLYSGAVNMNADFTWSPGDRHVLFAMNSPAQMPCRLFSVDRAGANPPQLFAEQPAGYEIFDCAWSPDGKQIAFSSKAIPQPVDWPIDAAVENQGKTTKSSEISTSSK